MYFAFQIQSFVVLILHVNGCAYFEKRKSESSRTDGFVNSLFLSLSLAIVTWVHICQKNFSTDSSAPVVLAKLQQADSVALHFKASLHWKTNFFLLFLFKKTGSP